MRLGLCQRKNGLPALTERSMKSAEWTTSSSSIVSMRLRLSGPVSLIVCLPTLPKRGSSVVSSVSVALPSSTPRGPNVFQEFGVLRIVRVFRFLLGIEVVEVAKELIEPVDGGQEFVAVTEVVLADLRRSVAVRLKQLGDGRILVLHALPGARETDPEQARAKRVLPCDEGGPTGRAGLLGVVVSEERAFLGDAVNVRSPATQHTAMVGTDIPDTDNRLP